MDVLAVFKNLIVPKFMKKSQIFALALLVGVARGFAPSPAGVIGVLLFVTTYLSTYFYNDLVDLEDDRKKAVYPAKLLVRGGLTRDEAMFLGSALLGIGTLLSSACRVELGAVAVLAVLLNNLRSHIRSVPARQLLLVFVEYLNFVAAYLSFFGQFPGLLASAVAIEFAALYALGHNVYKLRKRSVLAVLFDKRSLLLTALSALLFPPTLLALVTNPFLLSVAFLSALIYAVPQYVLLRGGDLSSQNFVDRAFWLDAILMAFISLLYLFAVWVVL